MARRAQLWLVSLACLGPAGCSPEERIIPDPPPASFPEGDEVTLVGAGDIADCTHEDAAKTAALVAKIPGAVVTLGDNAYPDGSLDNFLDCFDKSWGQLRGRMRPTIGNHEYHVPHAGAYFAYFGKAAGTPFEGYYSFDVGRWHVVSLNSDCVEGRRLSDIDIDVTSADFGGCSADSPQAKWLRRDLDAHPSLCTIAMWHHPRFSSGDQGDYRGMSALFSILVDHDVELLLSGHDHDYERFGPQLADGTRDEAHGVRQFVVGTGGATLTQLDKAQPNSERRQDTTHGVLKLTLRPSDYDWEFVPVAGAPAFADQGQGTCH